MVHVEIWGQFLIAAALIIFAGVKLTKYGDIISGKFNLGHAFIGAVLIGWSTSLPELVLSISTAVYIDKPNITMGNVLGSNLFNIFIIVMLDFTYRKGAILRSVNSKVLTPVNLSLVMILATGFLFYCNKTGFIEIGSVHIGISFLGYDSIIIFGLYIMCMIALFKSDKEVTSPSESKYPHISLTSVFFKCLAVIAIIVSTGLWLSTIATSINVTYKLNEGFVGSFFLAIVSSLPEVMTCFIALRMGFHNMAIGTLFGSNIFNMGIIAVCDIFFSGQIFKRFDLNEHYIGIFSVILMTLVASFTLRYKREKHVKYLGLESIILATIYIVTVYTLYDSSWLESIFNHK